MSRLLFLVTGMVFFAIVPLASTGCTSGTAVKRPPRLFDRTEEQEHDPKAKGETEQVEQSYRKASQMAQSGEDGAIKALTEFVEQHPQSVRTHDARVWTARLSNGQGQYKQTLTTLVPLLESNDTRRNLGLVLAARAHYGLGNPDTCATLTMESATNIEGRRGRRSSQEMETLTAARLLEGECRLTAGQHGAALKALSQAYDLSDDVEEKRFVRERVRQIVFELMDGSTASSMRGKVGMEPAETYLLARGAVLAAARGDETAASIDLRRVNKWLSKEGESTFAEILESLIQKEKARAMDTRPPVVGLLLPLEGRTRRIGWRVLWGAMLAAGAVGEEDYHPVGILVRNSGSNAKEVRKAVQDLAANPLVTGIIGPTDVRLAQAAADAAQELGVPIIALTMDASLPDRGSFVFRNFIDANREAETVCHYLLRSFPMDMRIKVAILAPDIPYGNTMGELFTRQANLMGAEVVANIRYQTDVFDFSEAIRDLKRAGEVHAIYIPDIPSRVAALSSHLAANGYWSMPAGEEAPKVARGQPALIPVQLLGTSAWYDPNLIRRAGRYLRGAAIPVGFLIEDDSPEVVDFVTKALAAQESPPDYLQAFAYDSVAMMAQLLQNHENRSRRGLTEGLSLLNGNWHGVTGTTGFNSHGNPSGELFMVTIDESGFIPVRHEAEGHADENEEHFADDGPIIVP